MTNMKFVQELLSTGTGTEGSLLIEKTIYASLVEEADRVLLPRELAALYFGPAQINGSSIDVDLVVPLSMKVREIAEGADIPVDQVEYTSFNMKPVKYGVSLRITREMLEDGKWNLLEHNVKYAGKRMAENENSLVISDALDNATNTISGGASVTIANITAAMQKLEEQDYTPTDFVVGYEVLNDIRNIDTFAEADKSGSAELLETGFKGTIYGMRVFRVSSNAGMTKTSAYVLDRRFAYALAEKRPLTVERFELPSHDMSAASVTHRLKARHVRADAICKITSS